VKSVLTAFLKRLGVCFSNAETDVAPARSPTRPPNDSLCCGRPGGGAGRRRSQRSWNDLAQQVEQGVLVHAREHGVGGVEAELGGVEPRDRFGDVGVGEAAALLGELELGVLVALDQRVDAVAARAL